MERQREPEQRRKPNESVEHRRAACAPAGDVMIHQTAVEVMRLGARVRRPHCHLLRKPIDERALPAQTEHASSRKASLLNHQSGVSGTARGRESTSQHRAGPQGSERRRAE